MSKTIQSIRGMNDVLPKDAPLWDFFEETVRAWARQYGYAPIRLPIVEFTPLFKRAIGDVTDIVEKEMYTFTDSLNGESLTLRPEGTAGCARAVIEHHLAAQIPQKLWYLGPMFRHERPQKGRYRQFYQVGAETFGFAGPDVDAELIVMCARLWEMLGLEGIRLELNSLGQADERAEYRKALTAYFEAHQDQLDEEAKRRLYTNPLRILDSKNPHMKELIAAAPVLFDVLGEASRAHFFGVTKILEALGIPYTINHRLVRGLDYYNLTVFEWVTDQLGAQGTLCGGGRYDGLVAQLGGKPTPACGFAMGVERLIALIEASGEHIAPDTPDFYVVHQGEAAALFAPRVAELVREDGFDVLLHCGSGNFKAQMKKADASGALFAIIIGDEEAAEEAITLKFLREESPQRKIALSELSGSLFDLFFSDSEQKDA